MYNGRVISPVKDEFSTEILLVLVLLKFPSLIFVVKKFPVEALIVLVLVVPAQFSDKTSVEPVEALIFNLGVVSYDKPV